MRVSDPEMRIFCQYQGLFSRIAELDSIYAALRAGAMDGPKSNQGIYAETYFSMSHKES